MVSEDLYIDGVWPDFSGKTLEQLIAQESWFGGDLDDEANVVWCCVDGAWHKLYFDGEAVCWRNVADGPGTGEQDGTTFPLNDLGEKFGLTGQALTACHGETEDEGIVVSLVFARGSTLTFRHRFDSTTVQLA